MSKRALSNSDDFGYLLEGEDNPQNIHLELETDSHLDLARLELAVAEAARQHPMMSARLSVGERQRLAWVLAPDARSTRVTLHACADRVEVDAARSHLLSEKIDVRHRSHRAAVLRRPDGDLIVFSIHHAVCDGMGALRFAVSVLRHYLGRDDSISDAHVEPVLPAPRRLLPLLSHLGRTILRRRTTLAEIGGGDAARNEFAFLSLDPPAMAQLRRVQATVAVAQGHATMNDVLLACLHLAVERWNREHAQGSDLIAIVSPVNVRPRSHHSEPVANHSSALVTSTTSAERSTLHSACVAVAAQTGAFKRARTPQALYGLMNRMPRARGWVRSVARAVAERASGTTILSNLGAIEHVDLPISLGTGRITQVRFAPPMPRRVGLAVGVASLGGRYTLSFRYRARQFDDAGADAFVRIVRDIVESA